MNKDKLRITITGGPGAGKTLTLLVIREALLARGFNVVLGGEDEKLKPDSLKHDYSKFTSQRTTPVLIETITPRAFKR